MADAARDIPRMSAAEYLQMEKQATSKHEFVNGVVYAMARGSREHSLIVGDVLTALIGKVAPPCQVHTSDMKVQIKAVSDECFYYPDTSVTCSDLDSDSYALTNPPLVIEVISRSTEQADRGYKFEHYRLLPTLAEYVLVHQDRACAEIYCRRTNWQKETFEPDAELMLESVNVALPVAAFCKRVRF